MMTFSTSSARYGVGGGASRRMPKGALMSGFEKPPRGRRLCPRRRTVDRAAVGQGDFIRQLATAWHVMRYVSVQGRKPFQFVASPAVRIVNGHRLLQFVADRRNRPGEIGVATHKGKGINIVVKYRIKEHFGGYVDVRSLLFEFDDGSHAICFVARNARLFEERHLDFVLCVEALYYLYTRQGGKSFEIIVLSKKLVGVVWVCLYPRGEILDGDNLNVASDKCAGKLFKVKPFVGSAFQHSVVQVEPVYVYVYSHSVRKNAKAGLPRPCAASAVPWRVDVSPLTGSVRIVPNSAAWRKEGVRVAHWDMNKRWGQIEAAQ